ncbi:glycosyltransferase [Salidesulfovibrio onnuriiensis]|uniref:glycosyltransferase n=1 Tax=Salidesulfovibrio onnuriiensis TaxID=2583823 RepID=UPI0011CC1FFF|nr:glycosyltransferase [Salidesulfovibrio onnuriiensis]
MLLENAARNGNWLRADLHVHSKHSTRPSQWILQKIGCPESFTEPLALYDIALSRGMDLVTITDHNTIDGALEIAHLPGAFISEEITTYFPDDGCKLHVLAWDITEEQHRNIQEVRHNVFELVPYLNEQGITHALAHPLFAVNDRLTLEHFEQALLLFPLLEANGTRDARQNQALAAIVKGLTRRDMEQLADKHGLRPVGERPWIKTLMGGSDDHSSLNIARMHTKFQGEKNVHGLLTALEQGKCEPAGTPATPRTMAHNLYGIAYQFYTSRTRLSHAATEHVCLRFADNILTPTGRKASGIVNRFMKLIGRGKAALHSSVRGGSSSVRDTLLREASDIIFGDPDFRRIAQGDTGPMEAMENDLSRFISAAANRVLAQFADRTLTSVMGANIFDVFHSMGSAGSLYALLAPYFVGYTLFSSEREFCEECEKRFKVRTNRPTERPLKMAHFTDTFDEVNGVAKTIRQQLELVDRHEKQMIAITCGSKQRLPSQRDFEPVGRFHLSEYEEISLCYPPFLDMLEYCFEEEFDCILAATPGPVGLAALAISRILRIPFHGTYHTAFPQYVRAFTEDTALEDGCWRFMTWFYNQMQVIYAPSEATKLELAERGIDPEKIITYPRGVDVDRFHPSKRNGFYLNYATGTGKKLLYVGRVSLEKGLDHLATAYRMLSKIRPDLTLVVVGDGPYLDEMRKSLRGTNTVFTGLLTGDRLAAAYASSDLFVFPSATDTFGNVVLEAQASGLPCIVTDQGGPCENIIQDETGLVIPAHNPDAIVRAVLHLVDTPERIYYMGRKARQAVEQRTFDATFLKTWALYKDRLFEI